MEIAVSVCCGCRSGRQLARLHLKKECAMKGFKGQSGFTLIELIVVIVILGILAATALPKFVNLGADARVAVMKGVEGSMRAANAQIYAAAAVNNTTSGAPVNTLVQGVGNVSTTYGYATDANAL